MGSCGMSGSGSTPCHLWSELSPPHPQCTPLFFFFLYFNCELTVCVLLGAVCVLWARHLHLHVISSDLVASALKTKRHYNSFSPRTGFLIPLVEVRSWFADDRGRDDASESLPQDSDHFTKVRACERACCSALYFSKFFPLTPGFFVCCDGLLFFGFAEMCRARKLDDASRTRRIRAASQRRACMFSLW